MPRPRDVEKTRDLALRATAVLERDGLTISAKQLAHELGIKRPTLLYHFPTYGHIVQAALALLLGDQAEYVEARVDGYDHPIDRLYARVRAIHEFHAGREGHLLFLSQAIALTGGGRVADILHGASAFFEAERRDMVARVEKGIADGIVQPCDAKALVALLRAVIDGLTIQRVLAPEAVPAAQKMLWNTVLLPLKREAKRSPKRARTKNRGK